MKAYVISGNFEKDVDFEFCSRLNCLNEFE